MKKSWMSKIEAMDERLLAKGRKIYIEDIRDTVFEIFAIDLYVVSEMGEGTQPSLYANEIKEILAKKLQLDPTTTEFLEQIKEIKKMDILDLVLHEQGNEMEGTDIRKTINQIFGINLDGISSIQHAGISIFSKGQWIIREESDWIVVWTGKGDVDLKVYQTDYFKEKIGFESFSRELHSFLLELGFSHDKKWLVYHYTDPEGNSISEHLKSKIFGAIIKEIENTVKRNR